MKLLENDTVKLRALEPEDLDLLYQLGTVAGIDIRDYSDATIDTLKLTRKDS